MSEDTMTERATTVPASHQSLSVEVQLAELRRWLEGYIDAEGKRHPGVIEMVAKLHDELEKRNERYEAIRRGVCVGFLGTLFAAAIVWFKDHYK
jgi:hypothetical protein